MNPIKPDKRDLQQQVAELRERVTQLETEARPRQISTRAMVLRILILWLVFALLLGFGYFMVRV